MAVNGKQSQMVKRVLSNTGEQEWYTPDKYIVAASTVMGGIDLDPASSEIANRQVRAVRYFTEEEDGLQQDWRGKVFLNPPYAMPWIRDFTNKLVDSRRDGLVEQAILLVNNATDTQWFQNALKHCDRFCLNNHRIRFLQSMGPLLELEPRPAPMVGQVFFYFGHRCKTFERIFSVYGSVARRCA